MAFLTGICERHADCVAEWHVRCRLRGHGFDAHATGVGDLQTHLALLATQQLEQQLNINTNSQLVGVQAFLEGIRSAFHTQPPLFTNPPLVV